MPETIAKDLNGNKAAEVLVSQATRDMARGKQGRSAGLQTELESLLKERENLTREVLEIQNEQSKLNASIKGRVLSRPDYLAAVGRQKTLTDRQTFIQQRLIQTKPRISELRSLPACGGKEDLNIRMMQQGEETNRLLRRIVELLEKQVEAWR